MSAIFWISITLLFCEYLIYYFAIITCSWPKHSCHNDPFANGKPPRPPLQAIILADPHLLGKRAHWLDKLRREWQMTRSFQTADFLHRPDVVFVLGDILDDGQNALLEDFREDVGRFRTMFWSSAPVICAVGNHDIGFHYRIIPQLRQRFEKAFERRPVELLEFSGIQFVLINSMAFEGDRCSMCKEAEQQLGVVSLRLRCQRALKARTEEEQTLPKECDAVDFSRETAFSKPIILQHFPMYRLSDEACNEPDEAPADEKSQPFRGKWECISKEATEQIMNTIEPRAVFGGHTHHGCYRKHRNGVDEWTISSFNWRNKINPSFLMVSFCPDTLAVYKCFLPNEHTVFFTYGASGFFLLLWLVWQVARRIRKRCKVRFD
ncbi:Metallophosphoesterase 1 [Hypsibius exemplaris]|uniref:Metallophosphoesterase 1 n=1 Tax=Hypsibius exemplaris TaxID=2072580 RepID=A0A1W0XF25_HYPEX|nr:Metallophosphoesterase 1 [Hypsibius exemplaris]